MRILIVIDKNGTAIWRLADSVKRNLPQHEVVILPIHPKGNDVEVMAEAQKLMAWCDIIDIHYWKSGQILRTSFPKEFDEKPRVLFHFNPYDARSEENSCYNKVVVGNSSIHVDVPYATLIPYGINLNFFKFNGGYTEEKVVNMAVNRIEGKKGVLEVAQACKELGYKFRLVGRVSKPDYMAKVLEAGGNLIEFKENATDEELREVYYSSAIHVCNSTDGYESGTLPVLENMAVGVPVLTRSVGHIPDLYDGANMVINESQPEEVEALKFKLKEIMENREWRLKLREKAWDTVKNRDERRMALDINRLYYSIYKPQFPLVSIVIPTRDHLRSLVDCLVGAASQDYEKKEIILVDSGDISAEPLVEQVRRSSPVTIKYIRFPHRGTYSLAEARNRGIIEADGEYITFCDDRIKMESGAVSAFVAYADSNYWLWGQKDGVSKGFVENFSFVSREGLIRGGMFCERMQWYGGMTQEIRERFEKRLNFTFIFVEEAKATGISRSRSKLSRMESIIEAKYLLYKMYGRQET
jgi:glycosyltransferase involved in cell wall biosynthesis